MLEVRVLGQFEVKRGQESATFPNETVRRLCKFLALHPNEPLTPEVISEACWPGVSRPTRTALYVAVSRLRQCLQPDLPRPAASRFVRRHGSMYTFEPDDACQLDYVQYGEWATAARNQADQEDWHGVVAAVAAAESLVRGDLLACEPYADWAESARHRFRQTRADLLELGLTAHAYLAQWPQLIPIARRILAEDNTREHAYRHLMHAYAATGEYGLALAAFDECRRTLAIELGVDPSPATLSLYADLLGRPQSEAVAAAAPQASTHSGLALLRRTAFGSLALPMSGRHTSLTDVPRMLAQGKLVVLSGEAGVGKSRLAAEVLTRLAAAGSEVLVGLCYSPDRARPYQSLSEALGPLWPDTSQGGGRGPSLVLNLLSDTSDRLFAVALARLQAAAQEKLVIIFLDDLHLADPDTVAFLRYLVPHLGQQPGGGYLAVLATARTAEMQAHPDLPTCLAAARRGGHLQEIPLAPLTADELGELVAACAAEPAAKAASLAQQLHDDSRGVALFAVERLRSLLDSGQVTLNCSDRWHWPDTLDLAGLAPPNAVQDLARQRTADLSPAAYNLLQASLGLRREAPFTWLAAIAGGDPANLLDGLEELLQRRVLIALSTAGLTMYSVGHHLIQEALYLSLTDARRVHLHRTAGHALTRLHELDPHVPAALIAHQFQLGEEPALAVAWYRRAGAVARDAASPGEAVHQLERAHELAGSLGDLSLMAACSEELAEALVSADGWNARAKHLFAQALEHAATGLDRARICLRWATACLDADPEQALSLAARAQVIARDLYAKEHVIWALSLQAAGQARGGHHDEARRFAAAAVTQFNEPDHAVATSVLPSGSYAVRHQAIWEATRWFRSVEYTAGEVAGYMYLADVAALSAHLPETEAWARYVLSLTEANEEEHALAQFCLAWTAFRKGDLDRCVNLLQQLVRMAEARPWPGILMSARLVLIGGLAEQGAITEAETVLTAASEAAETIGELRSRVLTRYLRAYTYWCAGDNVATRDWAQAALALGDGHLQRLDLIHLRRILGIAQLGLGEWEVALSLAEQNVVAAEAAGMKLDAALALGVKGKCLAMLGERERGRDALRKAIDQLTSLGAKRSASEASAMLAELDQFDPSTVKLRA